MWYNIDLNFRRAAVQIAVAFPSNVTLLLVSIDTFYMFCNLILNLFPSLLFTTGPFSYVPPFRSKQIYLCLQRTQVSEKTYVVLRCCVEVCWLDLIFLCVFFFTTGLLELLDSSS